MAIGPLSIDMYLPSLPALQAHFGADTESTQLTLSLYFIGLAIGQLIYGPVSDRFGRKKPLLFGLALYSLVSLACAYAPSMYSLVMLRFLQALGGCAGMVITRAMVRDLFPPQEMARVLSTLVLIMGVAPILAPLVGGQIFLLFGWQAIFLAMTGYSLLCFAGIYALPETSRGRSESLRLSNVLAGYTRLLQHRRFMGYALSGAVAQAGMFAYISASSFVFINVYGVSPAHFGWLFGSNALGLIAAAQVNSFVLQRYRSEHVLRIALMANAGFGVLLLINALTGFGGLLGIMIPLFCGMSCLGFSFPNSTAGAMAPFGDRAGMAAALLGTLQFGIAAISGSVVGHLFNGTAIPMAAVICTCAISARVLLQLLVPVPVSPLQK
ncbi:Bcr/CflA family drug resistance efflux transporter [Stenotrophobium rhamnosiphilum]|uniref:Bcr/CflA family efflux transporter n=2 Tax=Stenotrophobium rhamnosiphilum TaxID=2029166 RepID=A0A2T5ML34_9GAMM|nr:Bcr/CflA family drug resistance efflux transporter [Stenotrophobium rhamnosiphilum]